MHDADIPTPDSSPQRTALHARGWYSSPSTSAAAKWLCSTHRSLLGPRVSALGEGRLSTLSALVLFVEGGNSTVIADVWANKPVLVQRESIPHLGLDTRSTCTRLGEEVNCQKTRISFLSLQHIQAPFTQSHMPNEAFILGLGFKHPNLG
jgi:hypothetical protein